MSESLAIRGGRVIDPANGLDAVADVLIADGCVASVGEGVGGQQVSLRTFQIGWSDSIQPLPLQAF
ncbi:MAG: hypothetical protein ACE1ZT_02615, partial [Dehalococcoidia bacterium]